jgi:hypothetical protein
VTSGASAYIGLTACGGTFTHVGAGVWRYTFVSDETDASIVTLRVLSGDENRAVVLNFATLAIDANGHPTRLDVEVGSRLDETDALIEAMDALIDAIKAKTDLIGTSGAIVSAPVSTQGKIAQIFIGDDYLNANGRAFSWTIAEPTGFVAATSSCFFGGSNGSGATWLVTGTITDNGSTWTLRFDMTKTDTNLTPGLYEWTVEVKSASGVEHTVSFGGDTKVRRKYT